MAPFEPHPHLALALSGGADSMALLILARDWVTARGGQLQALTVDHRLRAGSTAEARQAAARAAALHVRHHILTWDRAAGDPATQAAARTARYRLLEDWCTAHGVLHLLVAHHREDQAETVAMRAAMGSGRRGLAAMAAVVEHRSLRLLRPLLAVGKADLQAMLRRTGQAWTDDPANRDLRFTRAKLRQDAAGTCSAARRAGIGRAARERADIDRRVAIRAAGCLSLRPHGYALLDDTALREAPEGVRARLWSAAITSIGGRAHGPRSDGLARLLADVSTAPPHLPLATRSLAGCLVSGCPDRLLLFREPARIAPAMPLAAGWMDTVWDGRFRIQGRGAAGLTLACLGQSARPAWARQRLQRIPGPARSGLPALWCGSRLLGLPTLDAFASGPPNRHAPGPAHPEADSARVHPGRADSGGTQRDATQAAPPPVPIRPVPARPTPPPPVPIRPVRVVFEPRHPVCGPGFAIAWPPG